MRKHLIPLIISCLLLSGCASLVGDPTAPTEATEAASGYYDPGSDTEQTTAGAVRVFPLEMEDFSGFLPMGEDVLVFSGLEKSSRLTLLTGENLALAAEAALETVLVPENTTLRVTPQGIHFYNSSAFLLLDASLQEISRITPPEDITGMPLLSRDQTTMYYCTDHSVQALDLTTGVSRMLKEIAYPQQSITGLLLDESVLSLTVTDSSGQEQTLYLSTENGATLWEDRRFLQLSSSGSRYYTQLYHNACAMPVFGEPEQPPQTLMLPDTETECTFLPQTNSAVLSRFPEPGLLELQHIDLGSGRCTASLLLRQVLYPRNFQSSQEGFVWFTAYDPQYGCNTLYCWDLSLTPSHDSSDHTEIYYTQEQPDYEGLAQCRQYADSLSARFGIDILIYRDAIAFQPSDYDMTLEYQVRVIRRELQTLETCLGQYPPSLLNQLKEHFPSIHICIVSQLRGSVDFGSPDTAEGIQFFSDSFDAYIALAAGHNTKQTLYHELCHLIDTVVLNNTSVYDRWDTLNPKDFTYDYDYIRNQNRPDEGYLQDENRYFIDRYSMSFPKEDRARIMEYAMTEGNEDLFRSTHMQSKLLALSQAIRDAFDLENSPEVFRWEQYLNQTLVKPGP